MSAEKRYVVKEYSPNSTEATKTYVLSQTATANAKDSRTLRLDHIFSRSSEHTALNTNVQPNTDNVFSYLPFQISPVIPALKTLFLPTGYPNTVTTDYTPYQIYDSLQAFASSIAGLLSSRAVLQSLNLISPESSSTGEAATAATLLSILQNTLSNLTTILFASHAAPRISSDVKYYRFLADVVNDAAFVLDLLAPALPPTFTIAPRLLLPLSLRLHVSPRVVTLCLSSILRAICGVAGGSSKAVLSTHFARNNPEAVGDLNAKDGSQETVVGLVGMWVGGVVVSRVESRTATWCWMVGLLISHLWCNWMAVRSVRLPGLNRQRAGMLVQGLAKMDRTEGRKENDNFDWEKVSTEKVRRRESVLGVRNWVMGTWFWICGRETELHRWRRWRMGVSVDDFGKAIRGQRRELSNRASAETMQSLFEVFRAEAYLLWVDTISGKAVIVLKREASAMDQLKSWLHVYMVLGSNRETTTHATADNHEIDQIKLLSSTLSHLNSKWKKWCSMLEHVGWELGATSLESKSGIRIEIE